MSTDRIDGVLDRFEGGVVVLDEAHSLSLSIGGDAGDVTICDHKHLSEKIKRMTDKARYMIITDRDLTLTPLVAKMLCMTDRDVVHIQFERAPQSNSMCYAFNTAYAAPRFPPRTCVLIHAVD